MPVVQGVASEASATFETRATATSNPDAPPNQRTASHVDESVKQITAGHQSSALKKVVQTQDEMLGALLDIAG